MNKQELYKTIDAIGPELIAMGDDFCAHPELPFEEVRSCEILCKWLEKEGFAVERAVNGVPTAFRAVYARGHGGPAIGLLCEYDALPNGHSCGHHMQGPAIIGAAKALKESSCDQPFRLIVYGTPAEENVLGKPRMIDAGCFRDIDVALMVHAHTVCYTGSTSMSGVNLDAVFTGVHAHDTACPWGSRSGFDAMMQAVQGIEYLRGHVHDGTRFFYQLHDGIGIAGNTDPSRASFSVGIRTYRMEDIGDLEERVRNILIGASMMCGVKVEIEKALEVKGVLRNDTLGNILMGNAEEINAPSINKDFENKGGSTDFGCITQMMPAACVNVSMAPEGMALHTEAILKEFMTPYGRKGTVDGAKILAATALELICDNGKLQAAKDEFSQRSKELNEKMAAAKVG